MERSEVLQNMCTKDSYGGLLSQEWTCVNSWKNPLREISCSRTNVDDRMMTACSAVAELGGGSVSAYRGKNYDENVRDSEVEFSERQRSFNGDERSGFSGGWLDSDGKANTRYVHGQNGVMPRLVSVFEASRGRKRKAEEETGFVGKHARVANCRDSKRDVKMSDADYRSTTPQSLKTLHDDRSVGHSSTMTSDLMSNKEVSGRFFRSSMISSHIPKCTEVDKTVGRFVRTSMRSSFVTSGTERTGDPIPVQWSTNSSASTNVSAEMMKLPRNVAVQFKTDSADRPVVSDCNRSLQSPEVVKNNWEVKTEKSSPVLAAASLAIGQSNSSEASLSDVLLRSAGIAQHPSFIAQEPLHRPASEFRRPTPPSNNGVVRRTDATTNPEQGMIQVSFLPPSDPRESDNKTLHESVYGYSNTGLPAVVTPSPVSEERRSEERLWRHLEPSLCEGDLLEASMSRNERFGAVQYAPFPNNQPAGYAEYNIEPGLLQSTRAYSGHNVLSPDYCTAAIPFQRMTIKNEIHQLQRQTVQGCGPNTSYNKKQSVRSEVYHWTEIPIKDQLNEKNQHVGVDTNPALRTREMNNRWTACQRENETKRLHRSKSLSPSVKSNVESGNFGSLQSIRTYYKTLGKAKNSPPRLETGAAEQADRCSRSQQVIECKAGETDMPIDLSSHVRKREQYDLDSTAIANNTTDRNIDCGWRRNTEISGGHVPQPRHVQSPEPGTILLTTKIGLSDRSGVDNYSESPLQVPSPSISQPGSRLSSAACLPDSHLPPKKRRMSNYFSPVVDPLSTSKEVLSASTSPDVRKSPAWDHIHPVSIDESLERETKTQLKEKTGNCNLTFTKRYLKHRCKKTFLKLFYYFLLKNRCYNVFIF